MELNGNYSVTSGSAEDLSEYTDADESMSAPTEILAEFLSALMIKDYDSALKYCKIILQYEPNHNTAKEFYPLLIEKIAIEKAKLEDNGNENSSDSCDSSLEASSGSSGDLSGDDNSSEGENRSDATTASYSSLEDEEADSNEEVPVCSVPPLDDNAFCQQHNGNYHFSDSESPTEPITQQLTTQLTSKFLSIKL